MTGLVQDGCLLADYSTPASFSDPLPFGKVSIPG